jgi:hypothetical protein
VLAINFLLLHRDQYGIAPAASLDFHAWGGGTYVLTMLVSILFNYGVGFLIPEALARRNKPSIVDLHGRFVDQDGHLRQAMSEDGTHLSWSACRHRKDVVDDLIAQPAELIERVRENDHLQRQALTLRIDDRDLLGVWT